MKLLICVQAVDREDPLFGFFEGWIRTAAAQVEHITVLALRVGTYTLPENVVVIPLRPQESRSQLKAFRALLSTCWQKRHEYDAVFVRGDAVYLVLAGWLWRLLGKRIVFWYTHYAVRSILFWLGTPWAQVVTTAVPESNPLRRAKAIGHHIDTSFFLPATRSSSAHLRILCLGRVSPIKRLPWVVDALRVELQEGRCSLSIVGKPGDPDEEKALRARMTELPEISWNDEGVPFRDTLKLYQAADVFINATPGSLDKTLLEAAATGCIVLAVAPGMRHGLPEELQWLCLETQNELRLAVKRVEALSGTERAEIGQKLRMWVEERHSLGTNVARTITLLEGKVTL